ncbi:hypothetical protein HMPREF6745_2508 [Prevotella sp. oral taxon 472 str. F0295]|nr:hypothetical protein [Prevotella sp. oral taxon 472]EEX51995.1 hypothetical protein HMPREF6745_2508 [Prevotella sp. oral taxon 472 str. F0295]
MTREEQIREAALAYSFGTDGGCTGDLNTGRDDFMEGAEWADAHPSNPWHNVADGDLPKEYNGDAICPTFLVAARGGDLIMAYYAWGEDEDEPNFYDDCDMALDAEWWMEIPKLPSE